LLATETMTLASFAQPAFVLPTRFPATVNRRGTIAFSTSARGLSGLGLRFNPAGAFTSFHTLTAK
jgi:hypothetical protein